MPAKKKVVEEIKKEIIPIEKSVELVLTEALDNAKGMFSTLAVRMKSKGIRKSVDRLRELEATAIKVGAIITKDVQTDIKNLEDVYFRFDQKMFSLKGMVKEEASKFEKKWEAQVKKLGKMIL